MEKSGTKNFAEISLFNFSKSFSFGFFILTSFKIKTFAGSMREEEAKLILEKTKEGYNKIAYEFSKKRASLDPDILYFKRFIRPNQRILDLGCGNGRFFEIANGAEYFGCDISEKMIEIAKERYPQAKFFLTAPFSLPFQDNFFDKVFCLAVFHHIPSFEFRMKFLKEIKRVLKKDGQLFLCVWNLLPKRKTKLLLIKYTILKLIGKSKLDFFDIFIPWKDSQGNVIIQRYFHVFTLRSLKRILKKAGFEIKEAKILPRSKKESNLFVLAAPVV